MNISNYYLEQLKKHNYKLTNQRLKILETITTCNCHVDAEKLHNYLKDDDISLATIYRNLEIFTKVGILKKLRLDNNNFQYDLVDNSDDHLHHHFICDVCGKVIEIYDDLLDSLEDHLAKKYGLLIKDHQVTFNGVCKSCQNQK